MQCSQFVQSRTDNRIRSFDSKHLQVDYTLVHPQQPTGNLCQFCGKVCSYSAGLKNMGLLGTNIDIKNKFSVFQLFGKSEIGHGNSVTPTYFAGLRKWHSSLKSGIYIYIYIYIYVCEYVCVINLYFHGKWMRNDVAYLHQKIKLNKPTFLRNNFQNILTTFWNTIFCFFLFPCFFLSHFTHFTHRHRDIDIETDTQTEIHTHTLTHTHTHTHIYIYIYIYNIYMNI